MYPSPWTTSVPPPAATKPIINSYENNMQSYPFYGANTMQNIPVSNSCLVIPIIINIYYITYISFGKIKK